MHDITDNIELRKKIISLLDLTLLENNLLPEKIIQLCQNAITPLGNVAAICIPSAFISLAKKYLSSNGILIATVANFPNGNYSLEKIFNEITFAINEGADEIDIVIPYHYYLKNESEKAFSFMKDIANACLNKIKYKLILETGELKTREFIEKVSQDAIATGAHFLKTSTGKTLIGATLTSAEIMLSTIKNLKAENKVGFKASGGIRTIEQAKTYIELAQKILGNNWVQAKHFRFGASSLLRELIGDNASKDFINTIY